MRFGTDLLLSQVFEGLQLASDTHPNPHFCVTSKISLLGDNYYFFNKKNFMLLAQFCVPSYARRYRYGMLQTSALHGPECAVVGDSPHVLEQMVHDGEDKLKNIILSFLGHRCVSMAGCK